MKKHCWDLTYEPYQDHSDCERCCRCGHSWANINNTKLRRERKEALNKSIEIRRKITGEVDELANASRDFTDREYASKIAVNDKKVFSSTWTAVIDPLYYVKCPHCQADIMMSKPTLIQQLKDWARKLKFL